MGLFNWGHYFSNTIGDSKDEGYMLDVFEEGQHSIFILK